MRIGTIALFIVLSVTAKEKNPQPSTRNESMHLFNEEEKESLEELSDLIKEMSLLLSKNKIPSQRNSLLLNRANAYVALSRIDLLQSKKMELSPLGKNSLERANSDIRELLSNPSQPNEVKAKVYFLEGLRALYLNKAYLDSFLKSLEFAPQASYAPWVSLMIAEEYFDTEKYLQADQFYKKYFARYDQKQKELALYKLAWCSINLKNYEGAEKYFLKIVTGPQLSDLAKDALRDLGYVMTLHRSDAEIVKLSRTIFKSDSKAQLDFLMRIIAYKEARQELQAASPLLSEARNLGGNTSGNFQLALSTLRSVSKEYASKTHLQAYEAARKLYAKELPLEQRNSFMIETEKLIKSFYESFTEKITSPESWDKEELHRELKKVLNFHIDNFADSPIRNRVLGLQSDLCTRTKDYRCLIESQQRTLNDPEQKKEHEKAFLETLRIWDELYRKDPKKFRKGALQTATQFLDKFPKSKSRQISSWRLSEYFLDDQNFDMAVNVLEKEFKTEPHKESFWRLQNARFKAKKYADVLSDNRMSNLEPRVLELRRESALQQAMFDKNNKNIKGYENSIKSFIENNPDLDKARIARVDYFHTLIQKKEDQQLAKEWFALNNQEKAHADYKDTVAYLWLKFLSEGDLSAAQQVLVSSVYPLYCYLRSLSNISLNKRFDEKELSCVDQDKKGYLQSFLLVSQPLYLWNYFEAHKPQSLADKSLAAWAYRLAAKRMDLPRNERTLKVLGPRYEYKTSLAEVEPLVSKIQAVKVPTAQDSLKSFSGLLSKSIVLTRQLRQKVAATLKKLDLSEHDSLANEMAQLEKSIGEAILNSPLPAGLSQSDTLKYKSGLEEASLEFLAQAKEFSKIVEASNKQKKLLLLAVPQDKNWPGAHLLKDDELETVKDLHDSQKLMGALVLLDQLREKNKKISKNYYAIRLFLLRPLWEKNIVLRQYLFEELKAVDQSQLLKEWRSFSNEK